MALRRAVPRRHVQPPASHDRRPPRLRDLLGRRPDGGRLLRGRRRSRARTASASSSTSTTTTTSRSTARRRSRSPRIARALRGAGLARADVDDVNDLDALRAAIANAQDETRAAVDDRRPLAHRLRRAEGGRHREVARLGRSARPRCARRRRRSAGIPTSTSSCPDGVYEHMNGVERGNELESEWRATFERWSEAFPQSREKWDAAWEQPHRPVGAARVRGRRGDRDARRRQDGDAGVQARGADDDRRRGRPRRVDEDRVRRRRPLLRPLVGPQHRRSASASTRWARS